MYLIDKLKMVNSPSKNESVDFLLLVHLLSLDKLSLKKISAETGLSRSSIIRFCQFAGYERYRFFIIKSA